MEDVIEYLPLYIGRQKVKVTFTSDAYRSFGGWFVGDEIALTPIVLKLVYEGNLKVSLILRRLNSIQGIEALELYNYLYPKSSIIDDTYKIKIITDQLGDGIYHQGYCSIHDYSMWFIWLLSKGFWLFDNSAFDNGLIIDSKTLNKEV